MKAKKVSTLPVFGLKLVRHSRLKYPAFQIHKHEEAGQILQAYLSDMTVENMAVLLVDGQMNYLGVVTVSVGSMRTTHATMRDVLAPVIVHRAHAFILGHNHLSGDVTPSPEDLKFTEELKKSSELMACPLLDHIIVSSGLNREYYSFHDHGLLNNDSVT
jgi:DNA repair protein RadC